MFSNLMMAVTESRLQKNEGPENPGLRHLEPLLVL